MFAFKHYQYRVTGESPTIVIGTGSFYKTLILTDHINSKKIDETKRLATVKNKEMNDIAPSYAGYLSVKENTSGNMFF